MKQGAVRRGNVVIVDFAPTNRNAGVRPALVVQNDRDNATMGNTVVVQITSNISRAHQDSQHLIDNSSRLDCVRPPSAIGRQLLQYRLREAALRHSDHRYALDGNDATD